MSPAASADEKSCWLEAQDTVDLSIDDLDSQGNILLRLLRSVAVKTITSNPVNWLPP